MNDGQHKTVNLIRLIEIAKSLVPRIQCRLFATYSIYHTKYSAELKQSLLDNKDWLCATITEKTRECSEDSLYFFFSNVIILHWKLEDKALVASVQEAVSGHCARNIDQAVSIIVDCDVEPELDVVETVEHWNAINYNLSYMIYNQVFRNDNSIIQNLPEKAVFEMIKRTTITGAYNLLAEYLSSDYCDFESNGDDCVEDREVLQYFLNWRSGCLTEDHCWLSLQVARKHEEIVSLEIQAYYHTRLDEIRADEARKLTMLFSNPLCAVSYNRFLVDQLEKCFNRPLVPLGQEDEVFKRYLESRKQVDSEEAKTALAAVVEFILANYYNITAIENEQLNKSYAVAMRIIDRNLMNIQTRLLDEYERQHIADSLRVNAVSILKIIVNRCSPQEAKNSPLTIAQMKASLSRLSRINART